MKEKNCYILGIESSCDDTAAAVINNGIVLSNVVATQKIHEDYGGVVPELASRAHQQNIVPVVEQALRKANIDKKQLSAIAFTRGPGLMGSLLVGTSFSKSLALGLGIPLIDVNHMQAHILAHFIKSESQKIPKFPFIALTISGGHTQIVKVTDYFSMEILGQTIDDAVGEAFDKSAKILGLSYPGGPILDAFAQKGNPKAYTFPKPKVNPMDFSFSGLKTSVLYAIQDIKKRQGSLTQQDKADISIAFEQAVVDTLAIKCRRALQQTGLFTLVMAGGVSANTKLREKLALETAKLRAQVYYPRPQYCTDNGAMIAYAGAQRLAAGQCDDLTLIVKPRWPLDELPVVAQI